MSATSSKKTAKKCAPSGCVLVLFAIERSGGAPSSKRIVPRLDSKSLDHMLQREELKRTKLARNP